MPDVAEIARPHSTEQRSVQHYIDERPVWSDGTIVPSVPMTAMQWRIWTLAAAGKRHDEYDLALRLLQHRQ